MRSANNPKKEIDTSNAELPPALPVVDVWNEIASYLDDKSLGHFSASCKFFYKTAKPILDKKHRHQILSRGVVCGNSNTFFLTANGEWWGCGDNEYGQLGVVGKESRNALTKIPIDQVKKVYAGATHILILKHDNTLWGVGRNVFGELGVGDSKDRNLATLITANVKEVFLGNSSTFILKDDLAWLSFGRNGYGELLVGDRDGRDIPTKIKVDHIKQIFPGNLCTFVLKQDGTLWGTGENSCGRLAVGDDVDREVLTPIKIFDQAGNQEEIVRVFPGDFYSLFLTKNGHLYGSGQLELTKTKQQSTPIRIPIDDIDNVFAFPMDTFILKKNGSIWGWGFNVCGVLGLGHAHEQSTLTQIESLPANVQYIFGSSYHAIFVTKEGDVWGSGNNRNGHLDLNGGNADQLTPVKLLIGNLFKPRLPSLDKIHHAFRVR